MLSGEVFGLLGLEGRALLGLVVVGELPLDRFELVGVLEAGLDEVIVLSQAENRVYLLLREALRLLLLVLEERRVAENRVLDDAAVLE